MTEQTPEELGTPSDRELRKLSPIELKDALPQVADEAVKTREAMMLDAGRGNPNWIATTPREAFFLLGQFALAESRRAWDEPGVGLAGMPRSPGIARRLHDFLDASDDEPAVQLLRGALTYGEHTLGFHPDPFVWELTDAVIGDNYPVPDRMLPHAERIVQEYLARELFTGRPPSGRFDLFAVEGSTAAMSYVFRSLSVNGLLHKGDTIALGSPLFAPYQAIPGLDELPLRTVDLQQSATTKDGRHTWQYPDAELRKLEDPRIKAFLLVNPSNPGAVAMRKESVHKLVELVRKRRPDLLIITDDVYGTFVNGFRSLAADLPRNTLLVYSYSKHFGCTGWRLGVVALHEDNILDEALAKQPAKVRSRLEARYGAVSSHPGRLKFIDRMVADSRAVALSHTAGLSLPQQLQMTLFSLFSLLDKDDVYKKRCQRICQDRLEALLEGMGIPLHADPHRTAYYQMLDLEAWCREHIGEDFVRFVQEHPDPLDIVFTLARRHGVVQLNGAARVSLANLDDTAYPRIGQDLLDEVRRAIDAWKKSRGETPALH